MTGAPAGAGARRVGNTDDEGRQPDRRRERGERTRTNILQAATDLVDAGNLRPTAWQVARRAGVSTRLVFHYFGRLEELIGLAAEIQAARHGSLIAAVPPHGPVAARVAALCRQRRDLYEALGPAMRAAVAREVATPGWTETLSRHRVMLREQLEVTLAPEIGGQRGDSCLLLDVLEYTTSWRYWRGLRSDGGYSAPAAERAMVSVVTELLACAVR
jgi:TetR/AcrR family transcriptional regulator, regulator of autoinduction and epiphytic fitness